MFYHGAGEKEPACRIGFSSSREAWFFPCPQSIHSLLNHCHLTRFRLLPHYVSARETSVWCPFSNLFQPEEEGKNIRTRKAAETVYNVLIQEENRTIEVGRDIWRKPDNAIYPSCQLGA